MRKQIVLLITLLFLFLNNSVAQCDVPVNENGKYELSEVVEFDSNPSKDKLYGLALIALSNSFKSSKEVIQSKDKELGFITGKFIAGPYVYSMGVRKSIFNFSIRLDFKEGRYRITVDFISHESYSNVNSCDCPNDIAADICGNSCLTRGMWNRQRCSAHEEVLNLVVSIKQQIAENLTADSEW